MSPRDRYENDLLARRSIGMPRRSIDEQLDKVRITLRLSQSKAPAEPVFLLDPPLDFTVKASGAVKHIANVTVWTKTSKMAAPSFSLPAGQPKLRGVDVGGTCPAAALRPRAGADDLWICFGCYATGGRYRWTTNYATRATRRAWCQRILAGEEPVVMGREVSLPRGHSARLAVLLAATLDQLLAVPRSLTIDLPDGSKTGIPQSRTHVRLHDSGDFFSLDYLRAWIAVAEARKGLHFWAPTRLWRAGPAWSQLMAQAPSNLVFRPSTLHLGDQPPKLAGLEAGAAVVQEIPASWGTYPPRGVWDCPAYRHAEKTCWRAGGPAGEPDCRVCWAYPQVAVNYAPHGDISKETLAMAQKAAAKSNPEQSLEQLFQHFALDLEAHKRPNPKGALIGYSFEAWCREHKVDLTRYGEEEWLRVLESMGASTDEAAEYLESTAEW